MNISRNVHIMTTDELLANEQLWFQKGLRHGKLEASQQGQDFPVREALKLTLAGLREMHTKGLRIIRVEGSGHTSFHMRRLKSMIEKAYAGADTWPVDKTGRWIGFIQAGLYVNGLLDIEQERNRTRPLFHRAYEATNQPIPLSSPLGWPECECRTQCSEC